MVKKYCPDCESQLEEIKACGCRDLFCQNCGKMISRSKAVEKEVPAGDDSEKQPE